MAEEEKKQDTTTVGKRNRWKKFNLTLRILTYVSPLLPASIIFGVNYNNWFHQGGGGISLPTGMMFLLVAIGLSVVIILKKDEEALKKVSPLLYASAVVGLLGLAFKALSSVNIDIGNMFLWSAAGLLVGFTADQVRKMFVVPKLEYYQKLVDKYELDDAAKAKAEDIERAKAEAEKQAQEEAEEKKKKQPETVE